MNENFSKSKPAVKIPDEADSWRNLLVMRQTRGGEVLEPNSLANTQILLEHHPLFKGVFVLNKFSDEITVMRCPPWQREDDFAPHRLEHDDITQCAASLEYMGLNASMQRTQDAINVVARKQAIHPARDYFESLQWDGEPRLATWLMDYAGAKHNGQPEEYLVAVGMKWMVAAAKRIYEPGCKFDHMLVLEGPQNVGKSTILRTMATIGPVDDEDGEEQEYFTDAIKFSSAGDPGSIMTMQGKLIIEISELAGMSRREIEDVKNWITIQTDEVQKKYQNAITRYPRQFVLAGTTNEDAWLRDHTGNRRFLPVRCIGKLDIPGLCEVRHQLWAEAVWLYKDNFEIWIDYGSELEGLASKEQQARMVEDVWMQPALDAIKHRPWVTVNTVLDAIPVEPGRRDETMSRRVGRILRAAGWQSATKRIDGEVCKIFKNPNEKIANREVYTTAELLPGHPVYDPSAKK